MIPQKAAVTQLMILPRYPSRFYYWDVLLFIHHWLPGDAGWQGA